MEFAKKFKTSAQDATTATLVPELGDGVAGDLSDAVSQIVITFASARDSKFFDVVNRRFRVVIERW